MRNDFDTLRETLAQGEMMARHFIVYCVSCFAFVLAAGCGDQAQSPLEEVKSEISRMPSFVHEKRWPTKSFYAMLQRQISELSKEARLKAFNFFEDILETVVINDTNLSEGSKPLMCILMS